MKKFLSAPHWIHLIVDTLIGQFIWWVISMMIGTPILVRSIMAGIILIATIFAVAWYLPRLSPRIGDTKTVTKTMTARAFITVPSLQDKALESDIAKLKVFGREYNWIWDGLNKVDPFMELVVTIINSNVFPILIKGVQGRFIINDQECAYLTEMEGVLRILHGESSNIRLKQRLSKDMANMIINTKSKINISLKSCKINIQPELEKGTVESSSFALGGGSPFEVSFKTS
jgi:hypothetical protein